MSLTEKPSRRKLLQSALAGSGLLTASGACFLARREREVQGSFVDRSHVVGHRIRDGASFSKPKQRIQAPIVIVGGGIAGLSAAWRLDKLGFREFVLLELESQAGGNSRWGESEAGDFPWGAHYIPVPDKKIPLVHELFEELGVLREGRWDRRYFCPEPQQRLFVDGHWQPEIEASDNARRVDRDQFKRFWDRMDYFRSGDEFSIPIRSPARTAALDRTSMKTWMIREGFFSPYLRWYVNYGCRDDYGASYGDTSAWAGIHYFAARPEDEPGPLTWPQGNGWVVKQLLGKLGKYVRTSSAVHRIEPHGRRLRVLTEDSEYLAEAVVFAAPTFLAPYLMPHRESEWTPARRFAYSPWLTANLVLDELPREGDIGPAWENIIYDSPGLGYVVPNHPLPAGADGPVVWTYYRALTDGSPAANRAALLERDWNFWKEEILGDLERAHADIRRCVSRIDILRLGHAMIRPTVGFLTSAERRRMADFEGNIVFANSDLSGVSIFEEAQYRGVRAAERALRRIGYGPLTYA